MDPTLIIFAALALFLSYRLFNVLGSRGGHDPDENDRPVLRPVGGNDSTAEEPGEPERPAPPRETLPDWAKTVEETTPGFDPKIFLSGATQAYEMIVDAYSAGDLSPVEGFVDPAVLKSFQVAIDGRRAAGQTLSTTFVGVDKPEVVSMRRHEDQLRAELRFRSEQIRVVRDTEGNIVEGDDERAVTVNDTWVFARPAKTRDPNWTLVATKAG